MKLNVILIMCMLLLSCNSPSSCKGEKVENKQDSTENVEFVEDYNLQREKYIHSGGYQPLEGYIGTPQLASTIAFIVLSSIYGEEEIKAQFPFSINLDNNVWIIEGFIEEDVDGGAAYIEINKQTGEILKILHSK